MQFKVWLEEIEKDRHYWEDFFLSVFHLDRAGDGLGKNLAGFNPKDLIVNSQFGELQPQQQQAIINKIQSGDGVIGDLAAIASGDVPPTDRPAPSGTVPVQQNPLVST